VKVNEPFKVADLRDLERAVTALNRIAQRHGDFYDDYEFDPINLARSAVLEAIREVEDLT
jgi:hypothetical protein